MAVLLAVFLVYSNQFQNGFHFDDFHTVVDNPAIRSLKNIPRFFTNTTTFSVLPANRTYRPIVSTSLAIDYALGHGYTPFWFHLITFVLFLGLVLLLNALYRLLLDKLQPSPANIWLALFGAAWFGLHPAMAETINYVIQRGDLYCTLGCVAALFLYARFPRLRHTGIYLVPYVFALLSKPPAAVFPLLLLLYTFFFEAPAESAARRLRDGLMAMLPSLGVTGLLLWLQSAMTPKTFLPLILSPWGYRLTQPYVWLRYTGELFLPLHLNVDTDLSPFSEVNLQMVAGLLFLVALLIAIWITSRRRTLYPIAFGLLWFVITQLPTSLYPLSEVENDHRMFFSFVGLILAVVWAAWLLFERFVALPSRAKLRPALAVVAVLVLCGYAYGVRQRNAVWRTEESLWRDDIEKSPHNGRGLMIYGLTQMGKGDFAAALDTFNRALVYTPNYATLEINLGVVNGAMADAGDAARTAEAERHFQRAISLAPGDDTTHAYYGRWLSEHGRYTEAIPELQTAVTLNPQRLMQRDLLADALTQAAHPPVQDAAFWVNQSLAEYTKKQYSQSIESARHALQLDPNSAEAWNNIAAGDEELHQWDDAIAAAQKAIALKPGFQLATNNLAWSLSQKAAKK